MFHSVSATHSALGTDTLFCVLRTANDELYCFSDGNNFYCSRSKYFEMVDVTTPTIHTCLSVYKFDYMPTLREKLQECHLGMDPKSFKLKEVHSLFYMMLLIMENNLMVCFMINQEKIALITKYITNDYSLLLANSFFGKHIVVSKDGTQADYYRGHCLTPRTWKIQNGRIVSGDCIHSGWFMVVEESSGSHELYWSLCEDSLQTPFKGKRIRHIKSELYKAFFLLESGDLFYCMLDNKQRQPSDLIFRFVTANVMGHHVCEQMIPFEHGLVFIGETQCVLLEDLPQCTTRTIRYMDRHCNSVAVVSSKERCLLLYNDLKKVDIGLVAFFNGMKQCLCKQTILHDVSVKCLG